MNPHIEGFYQCRNYVKNSYRRVVLYFDDRKLILKILLHKDTPSPLSWCCSYTSILSPGLQELMQTVTVHSRIQTSSLNIHPCYFFCYRCIVTLPADGHQCPSCCERLASSADISSHHKLECTILTRSRQMSHLSAIFKYGFMT